MHEILLHLPPEARVLDLGSREGSFRREDFPFTTIRVDQNPAHDKALFVQADATRLPFPSRSFDAVILSHVLEHVEPLKPALQEIGRVLRPGGAAYVAVPDASTFSDRLYRKVMAARGGHVNLLASQRELEQSLSWYFGLPHVATRIIYSSFSFLNIRNITTEILRRDTRVGLPEPWVVRLAALLNKIDRRYATRLSVYGWAFYFGSIGEEVDTHPLPNVCVRCGGAHPAAVLKVEGGRYTCPGCGAVNFFLED